MSELLVPLCEMIGRAGNGLRTLRLGGNGSWGDGVCAPLLEALSCDACMLEELDIGGCGLKQDEAVLTEKEEERLKAKSRNIEKQEIR